MMASAKMHTTKDGTVYYRIQVSRGRGRSPYSMNWYPKDSWSAKTTARELETAKAQFEIDCREGRVQTRSEKREDDCKNTITLQDYTEQVYWPQHGYLVPGSQQAYKSIEKNHIFPAFGAIPLSSITANDVNAFLAEQQRHYSYNYTLTTYNHLSAILNSAFRDGTIQASITERIIAPRRSKNDPARKGNDMALTPEEVRHILECAAEYKQSFYVQILLQLDMGSRISETLGLEWADIDFTNGTVLIHNNVQPVPGGTQIGKPKNGKSRIVDIGEQTLAVLTTWRDTQTSLYGVLPRWVFPSKDLARPVRVQTVEGVLLRFRKKYNMANFHFHLLRHTSASLAIQGKADVASVSVRLGHNNIQTTMSTYIHTSTDEVRAVGDLVRQAIARILGDED